MISKKQKIVLAILLFFISLAGLPKKTAAKSLYVIADNGGLLFSIRAYDIQENALVFQGECFLPYDGGRPLGLAIDSDSEILFIIYEFSNIIQLMDARKMRCLGSITAPGAQYLAAIALDHDASLLYAVEQSSDNLYVYDWDAADRTIEFKEKHDLPGLIDDLYGGACDIDRDEQNHLLYVSNRTNTVNFYRLNDPEQRTGSLIVSNLATAIAVDAGRGFVYSGGLRGSNYHLSQYDLHTKTEKTRPLASHVELKDIAVDGTTGFVYCTRGLNPIGGNLTSYDTSLNPIFMTDGRDMTPGALCIPAKEVKFNPLNLRKSDGIEKGGSVSPGSNITYTISYDNQGQSDWATGVLITDTPPKGAAFISAFGDYTLDGQTVTWHIGNLEPNAEGNSVGIVVQVDSDIKPGSLLHNTCSIKSDQWPSIYAAVDTLIDIKKHTLTISADPGGLTDPPLGSHVYEQGKEITITAIPGPGYVFSSWTGDVAARQEKENPLTLGMDSDKKMKANFSQTECRLTISAGLGGTTDPKPGTYAYDPGKQTTISAIPDEDVDRAISAFRTILAG
jgi:uncharacterized repeat protein (TIGR01451 family)